MWVYLLIFSIICAFCFIKIKQKELILSFLVVLLIIISGFRGNIDKDHQLYLDMYRACLDGTYPGEISFYLISWLVYYVFDNTTFIFLIYAILGVTLKAYAIRKLSEFWFCSILIYFSLYFLLHEMTQIRIGVAAGFILLSIPYIYKKNFKLFLLFVSAAFIFHYSSAVIIPFYFMNRNRISVFYYLLIPFAFLLYLFHINIVSVIQIINIEHITAKYITYKALAEVDRINLFNAILIMRYVFIIILLWKWKVLADKNKYAVLLIKFYIMSCFMLIILSDIPAIAFRISEIFAVVEFIVIPFFIYFFKKEIQGAIVVAFIGLMILANVLFYEKLLLPYF